MKILRRIKNIIKFFRKSKVPVPWRIKNEWYNLALNVPKESLGEYNFMCVHNEQGKYVRAKVGNVHLYHFADGRAAYYKVTNIHYSKGGDYLFNSDRIRVDLRLYMLI